MAGIRVNPTVRVSEQELAILAALADGARGDEIARRTCTARTTVETHIRILFEKLRARSRSHLVARAFRDGILTPDP